MLYFQRDITYERRVADFLAVLMVCPDFRTSALLGSIAMASTAGIKGELAFEP
jgi:hypothetical protein